MTLNLANLFFTPQAGGAAGTGQSPVLGGGGLFAMPSGAGGNFMDMIFAQLLQETSTGAAIKDVSEDGEKTINGENILSLLAPAQNEKGQPQGKFQRVQLNQILHKIAHEVSATIPGTGVQQNSADETGDTPVDILANLQSIIAQLQKIDANETSGIETLMPENIAADGEIALSDALPAITGPKRKDFMAFLNSLLQGIPQESKPIVLQIAPGLLDRDVKNLEFDPAAAIAASVDETIVSVTEGGEITAPAPALIATGLTPEELTKFIDELSQRLQKGESFIVGMVKILPPQTKREVIFLPRAIVLSGQTLQQAAKTAGATAPQDGIAAGAGLLQPAAFTEALEMPEDLPPQQAQKPQKQENPLLALLAALQSEQPARPVTLPAEGKKGEGTESKAGITALSPDSEATDDHRVPATSGNIMARLNALLSGGELPASDSGMPEESGFSRVLKVLEEARIQQAQGHTQGLDKAINVIKSMSPALSTFQGAGGFPVMGMAFAAALSGDIFPEGWDWSRFDGAAAGHPMTMNSPAMMAASLVNQAAHASTPHPATQMIAATITKAAASGENRNITVKLEPPELGRVEIRMEFGKEKSIKTHIIVEKQETYLMLQRDAHILDRTLQDSGLDTDGGVSFELSQDGSAFDDDRNNQRGASGGGDTETGTENAEEIIEATMDWYVDPDTGLTRYDIMA